MSTDARWRAAKRRRPSASALCPISEQRWLKHHNAAGTFASAYWSRLANDHKPLNFARLPQLELRRLIAMVVETRIAHAAKMVIIGLPLDRVPREWEILESRRASLSVPAAGTLAGWRS